MPRPTSMAPRQITLKGPEYILSLVVDTPNKCHLDAIQGDLLLSAIGEPACTISGFQMYRSRALQADREGSQRGTSAYFLWTYKRLVRLRSFLSGSSSIYAEYCPSCTLIPALSDVMDP